MTAFQSFCVNLPICDSKGRENRPKSRHTVFCFALINPHNGKDNPRPRK